MKKDSQMLKIYLKLYSQHMAMPKSKSSSYWFWHPIFSSLYSRTGTIFFKPGIKREDKENQGGIWDMCLYAGQEWAWHVEENSSFQYIHYSVFLQPWNKPRMRSKLKLKLLHSYFNGQELSADEDEVKASTLDCPTFLCSRAKLQTFPNTASSETLPVGHQ
jgi:hypothetical protein